MNRMDELPQQPNLAATTERGPSLPAMVSRIVQSADPIRVILFGSRARGTARLGSDVDFLVEVPTERHTREQLATILDALAQFPLPSDVILTTPEDMDDFSQLPMFVHYYAAREGMVVYERS